MKISIAGLDAIKRHEGLRLKAYPDPASGGEPFTVGYGHTGGVELGQTITHDQADALLTGDIEECERAIAEAVTVPLTQEQHDALCSFIFNVGAGAFRGSTLLRRLNAGDYASAADEFLRWDKAAGKTMQGLVKRRQDERAMFQATTTPPAPETAPSGPPVAAVGHSEENRAMLSPLLAGLAGIAIDLFAPLAKEKVRSVLERKGTPPAVVEQVQTAVLDAAKTITGMVEPVQAVAELQRKPELVATVQASTLDTIERLMPVLSQAHKWEQDAWAAEEASRAAAAARTRGDPHAEAIDGYLTRAIVRIAIGVLAVIAVLLGVLAWLKVDNAVLVSLSTLLVSGASLMFGKLGTRYDHAYGSSRSSGAKDVLVAELAQRNRPQS